MTDTQAQPGFEFALTRPHLLRSLEHIWWLPLLRGVASIAFGILAFSWPGLGEAWHPVPLPPRAMGQWHNQEQGCGCP